LEAALKIHVGVSRISRLSPQPRAKLELIASIAQEGWGEL